MRVGLIIGIVALIAAVALATATENDPQESIIYAEGIGLDGLEVVPDPKFPATIVGPAGNVMIDWSDNIVFHQFPAGQMVRTEVILHDMNPDGTLGPAVYTLTAHLMIQKINDEGELTEQIYKSSIGEGVFIAEGPNDFYSAEVNQEGKLLYGYNWDTRDLEPGWYRLTFWLEKDETCPNENPLYNPPHPIDYSNDVIITSHDSGDLDDTRAPRVGFVYDDYKNQKFWIDIQLLPKDSGRS